MADLNIRPARREDAQQILDFIQQLAEYEKLSHEVVATAEHIEQTLFCQAPKVFCLMAEWQGKPAGFALYFYNYSTFRGKHGLYLEDLFVLPEYRGQKIGFELLKSLAKNALQNNCARMEWSVLDWNQPAIDFYKSLGAVAMDEWTIFRLTDKNIEQLASTN